MALLEVAANRFPIECVPVAGAAAVVRPQNRVSSGHPRGLIVEKNRAPTKSVGIFRPPMHLHDQRIPGACLVIGWVRENAFHAYTVGALPAYALLTGQREVAIEVVVDAGH